MPDTFSRVETIIGVARLRRFTIAQKLVVGAEMMQPGVSISYVARRQPSMVFRWRRLRTKGGQQAVRADHEVVPAVEVRRLEEWVRELERRLGRHTLEVEISRKRWS
ncbi:MAG: transposase [Acetobacteraceae bacterium]